jgi:hypothetical protein
MEKEVSEISRELIWQGKVANKLLDETKDQMLTERERLSRET